MSERNKSVKVFEARKSPLEFINRRNRDFLFFIFLFSSKFRSVYVQVVTYLFKVIGESDDFRPLLKTSGPRYRLVGLREICTCEFRERTPRETKFKYFRIEFVSFGPHQELPYSFWFSLIRTAFHPFGHFLVTEKPYTKKPVKEKKKQRNYAWK